MPDFAISLNITTLMGNNDIIAERYIFYWLYAYSFQIRDYATPHLGHVFLANTPSSDSDDDCLIFDMVYYRIIYRIVV